MFIDAEDKESIAMFDYLCDTRPDCEPYMLELMVWAYKHKHDEYEAIMEKYKDTESYIDLDVLKHAENAHVSAYIPEDPEHLPSKLGEADAGGYMNGYVKMLQKKQELNPEFETEMTIVN